MHRLISIIVFVVAASVCVFWPRQPVVSREIGQVSGEGSGSERSDFRRNGAVERAPQQTLVEELVEAGWDRPAAVTFGALCDEAKLIPAVLGRTELAASLRAHPPMDAGVHREHPECLALRARLKHPQHLTQALRQAPHSGQRQLLLGSCLHFEEASQLDAWVASLARHGGWVSRVLEECPVQDLALLLCFDRGSGESTTSAIGLYDDWLAGMATQADGSPRTGADLRTRLAFIHSSGSSLRHALGESSALREQFPRLWPELRNALEAQSLGKQAEVSAWALTGGRTGLWRFILRPEALPLFRAHGVLAVEWLDGEHAVHPEGADLMVRVLRDHRYIAGAGLIQYGDSAEFRAVCRRLDTLTMDKACYYLLEGKERFNVQTRISEWNKNIAFLHDDLTEAVGLWPTADFFHAAGKIVDGRLPSVREMGLAAWDAISTASGVISIVETSLQGIATTIFGELVKQLGESTAKAVVDAVFFPLRQVDPGPFMPRGGGDDASAAELPMTQLTRNGNEITSLEITRSTFHPSPGSNHAALRAVVQATAEAARAAPTDYRAWQRHYLAAQLYLQALNPTR